jgi:hypothetical protein
LFVPLATLRARAPNAFQPTIGNQSLDDAARSRLAESDGSANRSRTESATFLGAVRPNDIEHETIAVFKSHLA